MTAIPPTGRTPHVLRFATTDELVDEAAAKLLTRLLECQAERDTVHLCLTGGRIANQIYAAFADLAAESDLDVSKLHVWWSDDRFVPTIDPERNAIQSLSVLARRLQLNSAQIHPMPASDGNADPGESAFSYAQELGGTVFDLCLLGMGPDGHTASIFPNHPSFDPTSKMAIGVQDAPKPPPDRISLTIPTMNRSRMVWFFVSGQEKADAVARVLAGDLSLPATHVNGVESTAWFLDAEAAAQVPTYACEL